MSIEIDVKCSKCKEDLSAAFNKGSIEVDPCDTCLGAAQKESYNEGQGEGYDSGYKDCTRDNET